MRWSKFFFYFLIFRARFEAPFAINSIEGPIATNMRSLQARGGSMSKRPRIIARVPVPLPKHSKQSTTEKHKFELPKEADQDEEENTLNMSEDRTSPELDVPPEE